MHDLKGRAVSPHNVLAGLNFNSRFDCAGAGVAKPNAIIGNTGMTCWVDQLAEFLSEETMREDWHAMGSAAILEHNIERHAFNTAESVAARLGVPLTVWTGDHDEVIGPTVLYVDRAYWGKNSPQQVLDDDYEMVSPELLAALHRVIDEFDPVKPIVIILSCYDFTHVPKSLRCIGKFDRRFNCRVRSIEQIGSEFLDWVGWSLCDESLQLKTKQVGRLLQGESMGDRRQGLMVAALRRCIRDEVRLLKFTDIVHFVLHGTAEFDVTDTHARGLYRVAVHEAGHAVVAMLDSAGADIPDYASIGTSHDFAGITTHSFSHRMEDDFDQSVVLHRVRNALGGRAAEEVVFGVMGMSARGNSDDLGNVSSLLLEMYLSCGMFSDFDDLSTSTDHLIVAADEPAPHQLQRAEEAARVFVATQYRIVLQMLRDNRALLDAVIERLNVKLLLDCDDFALLWQAHQSQSVNKTA